MDERRMTERDTPCPRGTKTKPCKMIQWIAQTGRYSCYGCGRIFSARDVELIRNELKKKKRKVGESSAGEQLPLLGE
jgi:hypothetical protein